VIVVTTPTGRIGRQVLGTIADSTEAIRVITRDPARLPLRVRERAEVMRGSDDDISVVTKAFTGADCVFWLVPPNPRTGRPADYYRDFTRPACEAIRSQGVRRVVRVSTLGYRYPGNAGLLLPGAGARAAARPNRPVNASQAAAGRPCHLIAAYAHAATAASASPRTDPVPLEY
jgi:nucleoside-diphosphate-sugar epimerase